MCIGYYPLTKLPRRVIAKPGIACRKDIAPFRRCLICKTQRPYRYVVGKSYCCQIDIFVHYRHGAVFVRRDVAFVVSKLYRNALCQCHNVPIGDYIFFPRNAVGIDKTGTETALCVVFQKACRFFITLFH